MSSRWKPGQSGNPNGRPKTGNTIRAAIREKLDREAFAQRVIDLAMAGNEKAIRMVFQYHDGLPAAMAPDEGQVSSVAPVILMPSNGRDFREAIEEPDDDDEG